MEDVRPYLGGLNEIESVQPSPWHLAGTPQVSVILTFIIITITD